jgi:hypothetical protein
MLLIATVRGLDAHGLLLRRPESSADAVVPALVVPAVDLARGVALVFGAVGFPSVGHFNFCQVFGYLLGHVQPRS